MKCGNLVSTVLGWKCEKCGIEEKSANEVWNKQEECRLRREQQNNNGLKPIKGDF